MAKKDKGKRKMVKSDEPVAKRTRLRSGAPMFKTKPVQYPHEWLSGRFRGRSNSDAGSSTDSSYDSRASSLDKYLPSTSRAANERDARKNAASGKKQLRSSLIQLVKVRSNKPQDGRRSRPRRKGGAVQKGYSRKRPSDRRGYRRKISRRRRSRRRRRRRSRRKRRRSRGRRRRKTDARRKGRRRRPSRYMLKVPGNEERKPAFKQCPPLCHELDEDLTKRNRDTTRGVDKGHREGNEDPLNVKDICRSLVKGMAGMPHDNRETNFQEDGDMGRQQQQQQQQPNKENEKKKKHEKNSRRARKAKQRHQSDRRGGGHRKRRPGLRKRNVKHGHRWAGHSRRHHRAKDVQGRQKSSRLAEVARRRRKTSGR